jgi:hypothetical protein
MIKDAIMLQDYTQAIDIWNNILQNDIKQSNCLDLCNNSSISSYNNNSSNCKSCK